MNQAINISNPSAYRSIKRWIWVYFFLLIFEGALRKWFLPSYSDLLLIIRDPIVIGLIIYAWFQKIFVPNIYIYGIWIIGFLSFITTLILGHGNLWVATYGVRILVIYIPFIFLIGKIFTRNDVLQMGKTILLLAIPMTLLIAVQFYSPQSAWVNRGLAGSMEGAGFSGALGYFRPPGTFSFIVGVAAFYGLAACFVWYFWFRQKEISRWLLIIATCCLLCAIPLSISRTLFFQVLLTSVFAFMYTATRPQNFLKFLAISVVILLIFFTFKNISFFQTASDVFLTRFSEANTVEGGAVQGVLGNRYLGSIFRGITDAVNVPFWGYGIGMGTNAGSSMLVGEMLFLVKEEEWGRVVGEQGMLLGLSFLFMRVWLGIKMSFLAYRKMGQGDVLPWLLASFTITMIIQGQWSQPTILGFAVLLGGLTLASLKTDTEIEKAS